MGFCIAMVSNCDYRLVIFWNLMRSVCMFYWGTG